MGDPPIKQTVELSDETLTRLGDVIRDAVAAAIEQTRPGLQEVTLADFGGAHMELVDITRRAVREDD